MKSLYLFSILLIFLLIETGCAVKPPHEKRSLREPDLVELIKLDSTIKLDIRYATSNNFAGRPVYSEARAFLQRDAAVAVVRVNKELKSLGFGLLVFDGYRPWSVTKYFWDITPREKHIFVADPKIGSVHNRGCAVDLSLYEIATGREVQMPGAYDEMSERSYSAYTGGTETQRKMRDLLRSKMEEQGFKVLPHEWWHFNYKDSSEYRIGNIPFSDIK
ncbi:M15 family metallopeptidase [Rubrolithibacter danxiaensis]|uniref:M15 family metallopeptidase n=1 Tax=Rubrolithibacter danxiaensis TaxID=3390805 RepID=UPI003BF7B3EB